MSRDLVRLHRWMLHLPLFDARARLLRQIEYLERCRELRPASK